MSSYEVLKSELDGLSAEEKTKVLIERQGQLEDKLVSQQQEIDALKEAINKSTLFFNIPEVKLVSGSMLPRVIIHAKDPVGIDANMYTVEADGEREYRWLGPKRVTNFSFPVDRSVDKTLIFRFCAQITEGLYGSLKIYIDGDIVEHELEVDGNVATIYVSLPGNSRVQETTATIFVPKLFMPAEVIEGSDDKRLLSVALTNVEIV